MSKSHDHGEGGHHHDHSHKPKPPSKGMQRHHVFMLVGAVLMLAAMVAYIFSFDESVQPGGAPAQEVPADAAL
ncbi:hypothetical protein SH661x_001111 [Planctomicrobium sp. SH661]|uniref:hypothetical protein n=1 Tax=Planctomicrobium sp. SH661 TaxID=3448124 RepID=UPI003F5C7162